MQIIPFIHPRNQPGKVVFDALQVLIVPMVKVLLSFYLCNHAQLVYSKDLNLRKRASAKMNVISRGIRNAFRNVIRTFSIVIILGLSIGLSLTMLIAHQAVGDKIQSVKASVGNTVSISPAGVRGFEGGGNPLTDANLTSV